MAKDLRLPRSPPNLETLIREKQDQLRGRPLYWWEIVVEEFNVWDWLACIALVTIPPVIVLFW